MFFVNDVNGKQHDYVPHTTRVGLGPQPVADVKKDEALSPRLAHPESKATEQTARQGFEKSSPIQSYNTNRPTERKTLVYVSELMTMPVIHLYTSSTLAEALVLFEKSKVRHLPILSKTDFVIGMLSERDALRALANHSKSQYLPVDQFMTHQVLVARPETTIRESARVMFEAKVGSILILDPEGILLGILTRSDILRAVVNTAPLDLWS